MKDPKSSLRYLGFQPVEGGSRRLEFSFSDADAFQRIVSVDVPGGLFSGPDHISVQECTAICYETVKSLIVDNAGTIPDVISLTAEDITQHRKLGKPLGRR